MKVGRLVLSLVCVAGLITLGWNFFSGQPEVAPQLASGTLGSAPGASAPPALWIGPEGAPLPFRGDAEVEEFLATAEVVSRKRIQDGINKIDKLLLEQAGVRAHGAFRDVSVKKTNVTMADGTFSPRFRDDCIFEVAAYRLSRMLGVDNVPPAVKRRIGRRRGTLQLWIENAFTQKTRLREQRSVPQTADWRRQMQTMYLFDRLIANGDRNQGNILVDGTWKLWMIDHTRAFRLDETPATINVLVECDREVWKRLQLLDPEEVLERLEGVLTRKDVEMLFSRRDALVAHFRARIERLGEDAVLVSAEGGRASVETGNPSSGTRSEIDG